MGYVLCGAMLDGGILCPIYMQESTREVITETVDYGNCYISNILIPEGDTIPDDAEGDPEYYKDYLEMYDCQGVIKTEQLVITFNAADEIATFISEMTLEEVNSVSYDLDTEFDPDEEGEY